MITVLHLAAGQRTWEHRQTCRSFIEMQFECVSAVFDKRFFLVQPPWLGAWGMNQTLRWFSIDNERRLNIGFVPCFLKRHWCLFQGRKWKSYREFMILNGISLTFSVAWAVGSSAPTYFSWPELLPSRTPPLCRCSNQDQEPLKKLLRSPFRASLFRLY